MLSKVAQHVFNTFKPLPVRFYGGGHGLKLCMCIMHYVVYFCFSIPSMETLIAMVFCSKLTALGAQRNDRNKPQKNVPPCWSQPNWYPTAKRAGNQHGGDWHGIGTGPCNATHRLLAVDFAFAFVFDFALAFPEPFPLPFPPPLSPQAFFACGSSALKRGAQCNDTPASTFLLFTR